LFLLRSVFSANFFLDNRQRLCFYERHFTKGAKRGQGRYVGKKKFYKLFLVLLLLRIGLPAA
jgi:hypothetical protein